MPPVAQLPRVCALLPRPSCDVRARSASRVTCMTMEAFCHSNNMKQEGSARKSWNSKASAIFDLGAGQVRRSVDESCLKASMIMHLTTVLGSR